MKKIKIASFAFLFTAFITSEQVALAQTATARFSADGGKGFYENAVRRGCTMRNLQNGSAVLNGNQFVTQSPYVVNITCKEQATWLQ